MAHSPAMTRQRHTPARGSRRRLVVVAHDFAQARAACRAASAAGAAVEIRSAPGAAGTIGPAWFAALVSELRAEFPGLDLTGVLDCGDAPGHALAALRQGIGHIRFIGRGRAHARLASIAEASGAVLAGPARNALDLAGESDPDAACRARLEKFR